MVVKMLDQHLREECLGFSVCPDCNGQYKKGRLQNGKDFEHRCVDFLSRLVRQIAGTDSYQRACQMIVPQLAAFREEQCGTLETLL